MHNWKKTALLSYFLIGFIYCKAQQNTIATGSDLEGSGGSISYSVGQLDFISNENEFGIVDQGVQHSYEIFSLGISKTIRSISANIYPNPTTDYLTIVLSDFDNEFYGYQITDINGRVIQNARIESTQTIIDVAGLDAATYLINIKNNKNLTIQTFKVIKSN